MKYKSSVLSERAPQQAAVPLKEKIAIEGSKKKAAIELDDSEHGHVAVVDLVARQA